MRRTPSAGAPRLQNYVRNLVDFQKSVVGHLENFDRVAAYLAAGDNVVMLANHQTEADPGAHPLLPCSAPGLANHQVAGAPRLPSYFGCSAFQLRDMCLLQASPASSNVNAAAVGTPLRTRSRNASSRRSTEM